MLQIPVFNVLCERIGRKKSYLVKFQPNNQLIDRIKELPHNTRTWSASERGWIITAESLYNLIRSFRGSKKIHFNFGSVDSRNVFISIIKKIEADKAEIKKTIDDLNAKKEHWIKFKNELELNYLNYSDIVHEKLKNGIKLYPHQIVATMFINETRNTLISHEMGLGKTLSSIAYVEINNFKKVVVITPNSLKFNYKNEVDKFTNSKSHIVKWKKNGYDIQESKYIIFNYEYINSSDWKSLEKKWNSLNIKDIDAVICDEAHRLKNTDSNTFKNFKRLFNSKIFKDGKESKVFLSGTPAPNRAYELYTVLNQISPIDFPTKKYFYEYYCGMVYNIDGWGYEKNAEGKYEELYHKISAYTHRKRKIDALKDLPDKTIQKIILEMSDKEFSIYNDIENSIVNEINLNPTKNALTIMIRLRQYLSDIKIKQLKEIIDNAMDGDEKIVIIDAFKDSLYKLKEIYGDISGIHTGDQSVEERAKLVNEFQDPNSKIKIFLGSIQTCNYGLTLTAANKMFILTLPYSVGEFDQVSDRIHRIGQKNVVNIYILTYLDTIDEIVFNIIESKRKEIVKVIDNVDYESDITDSVLNDVIKLLKKRHG